MTPHAPGKESDGAAVSQNALLAVVAALLQEMKPGRVPVVALESQLERDLGLDSLARAELLLRIERTFGVRLPEATLAEAETPADLWRALHDARAITTPPLAAPAVDWSPADAAIGVPVGAATLVDVLRWHAEHQGQRLHMRYLHGEEEAETLSYGELLSAAEAVAHGLLRRGLAAGATVAIMLPSGPDFFRAFFGALLAGAVPVPLYPPARASQIEEHLGRQAGILESCQAAFLLVTAEVRLPGRLLQARVAGLSHVLTLVELVKPAEPMRDKPAPALPPLAAGDTAFLQYTSGSTGDPKGVVLSHANLLANIRAWSRAIALSPTDVVVSWLPLYHDMGLIGAWLGSLYNGLPLVLMSPLDFLARPQRWLWAIHRYRGTVSAAPNFAYEMCARRIPEEELAGLDLSCWRLAANGAEPVSAQTLTRFAQRFAPYGFSAAALAPVYGLAECTVGLAVPPPGRGARIERVDRARLEDEGLAVPAAGEAEEEAAAEALALPGCGFPLPGHETRIVDRDGRELPERRIGQLEFRGPSATSGYFSNPPASRRLFHDGWLDSGDLAYLANGEVFLTGRVKDIIIRAGRNLYPYELEAAIGDLPEVRRGCVAVFGVADAGSGSERLVAVVEIRPEVDSAADGGKALRQAINELALKILGEPFDDVALAPPHAVLKTSSGKIRRAAIREHYLAGTLSVATRHPAWQVTRLLAAALAARLRGLLRSLAENLYAAWVWSLFALLAPLGWLAVVVGGRRGRFGWPVARAAARLLLRLAGAGLRVSGLPHLPASGPCVLVANHASYLDGLVLAAALPRAPVFVAKQELVDNWIARRFLVALGAEFVERFDAGQSLADLARLVESLRAGECLLVFPEGTFRRSPGLLPFRLGAFQAAAAAGAPLLPVAIVGSRAALPDESWRPRRQRIAVTVGTPIAPSGDGWAEVLALRDSARAQLLALTGEHDLEQI